MTQPKLKQLEHLAWTVEARARNQRSALRLLTLFASHKSKWTSKRWARPAQSLLSVTFSLWRAAFLAEKTGKRSDVFEDGVEFLERLIADNAISYPQDKKSNEWTFNYYTRNARAALMELASNWPAQVDAYEDKIRSPTDKWTYCQDVLDRALDRFDAELKAPPRELAAAKRREAKLARKQRRKISRDFAKRSKQAT